MAHEIQIPASFEFRTTRIKWEEACANVIGWRSELRGNQKALHLIAEIKSTSGNTKEIGLGLDKLPEKYKKECLATAGKRHANEAVRDICSDLELRYFVHGSKTYVEDSELRKHSQPTDAWELRDDFLGLRGDREKTLEFLNKWGRWVPLRSYVDPAEISALQKAVRGALMADDKIWFRSRYASPPVMNSRSAEFPYFVILTDACEAAIRTTTTIDLLRQLKFKPCARPDCAKPFPITSKHERDYCTQYCAHLESVRRSRKSTTTQRSV